MKDSDKKWVLKRKHAQIKISRLDIKYLKDKKQTSEKERMKEENQKNQKHNEQ